LLMGLIFYAGERILRLFDDESAPIAIALAYLRVVAPSYVGLGIGVVLGNAMAGAGATRTTMWIDVAVILGFQAPLCILATVAFHLPIEGLFRCVALTNVVSAVVYTLIYARGNWRGAVHKHVAAPALP
ncbi:MAG: MATE family efflux transporter, partial [Polyangiaceae bacterium]